MPPAKASLSAAVRSIFILTGQEKDLQRQCTVFSGKGFKHVQKHGQDGRATFGRSSSALAFLILLASLLSAASATAENTAAEANQDSPSVWIISTRCAPLCGYQNVREAVFDYRRLVEDEDGCRQWLESNSEEFHATDKSDGPTCFNVHGNRMGHCHAIGEGLEVLECLKRQSEGRKFRLVIWSWPSAKIKGGNRKDVRVKAARSDVQAYYLARCLRRMNPETQVGMIGYSFGARIIAGALEILAGGQVAGRRLEMEDNEGATAGSSRRTDIPVCLEGATGCLPASAVKTAGQASSGTHSHESHGLPNIRIALIAAATDRCWFMPCRRNGSALDIVDWALITCNPCDPVLKHYPKMYGCRGPQAAGYTGPALTCEQREKTEVINLSCSVGKSHKWCSYLYSPCLYWRLGECVFEQ